MYIIIIPTPRDDGRFENEVCLLSGVEDFDEHPVHVVSLDSVPEQRHQNEVIAEHVEDMTAEPRVGEVVSNVKYNEKNCQRYAQV